MWQVSNPFGEMEMKLETRSGKRIEVKNIDADKHRLKQITGHWMPAGAVCCYLGISNPFGFGSSAELKEVRLSE